VQYKAQVFQGVSFNYLIETCHRQAYETNISGVRPVWYPFMQLQLPQQGRVSHADNLDIEHYMGDPSTVSGSLDCCNTFPWTAAGVDRIGSPELFHNIN
jgi:hypothetical protein